MLRNIENFEAGQFVNTEGHGKIAVLVQFVPLLIVSASES